MDDTKLLVKNEYEIEALILTRRIYSQDMKTGFGIEKYAMLIMKEKQEKAGNNKTVIPGDHQKKIEKTKIVCIWEQTEVDAGKERRNNKIRIKYFRKTKYI